MALESFCAACTYLGETVDYRGKYRCEKKGEDHYATDPKCNRFCEAYSRSTYARQNMYEKSKSSSGGSGCFITTALCNILGYDDNHYYLKTLRNFRDEVLKNDRKYWSVLITYDLIGPVIAANLWQDNNKVEIAETLLNNYISKVTNAIEAKNYNKAIEIYTGMTEILIEKYGITYNPEIISLEQDKITDPKTLGHGRKKVLV